ncbi:vesicle-associated membrane protein VAMP7 [Acrasis kona]|uniref:Vesicle-associated membrane protein VAMP7 n=1 Tax=Acrasis kona TaxID=1008807 RepID=A0AAW2YP51_9EUKA
MPILYANIVEAAGTVKGQYPAKEKDTNFSEVILNKIVPRVEATNHKRTLTQKQYEYHYKYSGAFIYFCVAENASKRVCWAFIDDVEELFLKTPGISPSKVTKVLEERIKFYNNPANDKVAALQNKVDEVREVMIDNLDQILDRGEKMDVLVDKTNELQQGAGEFRKGTRKVKRAMLVRVIVLVIILVVIILIVAIALGLGLGLGLGIPASRIIPIITTTAAPTTTTAPVALF